LATPQPALAGVGAKGLAENTTIKATKMNGYAGKILDIDLSTSTITHIPTSHYSDIWVGGHGMGSAIFFDRVKDKTIDGFHPDNVVTMMTSPFCGTPVPAGGGRTEVQGIGVQSFPTGWFTRSNFGGRFSSMLKYAGWDGIVITGRADQPVWIDIRNDDVRDVVIRDCSDLSLWGMKTRECQETIWNYVANGNPYGDWMTPSSTDNGQTTQRPAVVCIGPAGENRSRMGCLMHDRGNSAGQGGFGGIWGSKNLKAISVIGTGGVHVHDPAALVEARRYQKANYELRLDDLRIDHPTLDHQSAPIQDTWRLGRPTEDQRPQSCVGCHAGCRARFQSGLGNEVTCYNAHVYYAAGTPEIMRQASDLINDYGVNAHELQYGLGYLERLYDDGLLHGLGCPLDFGRWGEIGFFEHLVKMISYGNDGYGHPSAFGEALKNGFVRAAKSWGRLEEDLRTERLWFPYWGIALHRDPRAQLEWGYGTILSDRDINEHDFDQWMHWYPTAEANGTAPFATAEEAVKIHTDKMAPYAGDMLMLDYSTENMYSEHIAKLVAWHRHYTRFWKQSLLLCDWRWPDFMNMYAPGKVGSTGEAEPKFLHAVTGKKGPAGKDFTFLDGMELGRKIWNLDQAIWTLQGRHRDDVRFADYVYDRPYTSHPQHWLTRKKHGVEAGWEASVGDLYMYMWFGGGTPLPGWRFDRITSIVDGIATVWDGPSSPFEQVAVWSDIRVVGFIYSPVDGFVLWSPSGSDGWVNLGVDDDQLPGDVDYTVQLDLLGDPLTSIAGGTGAGFYFGGGPNAQPSIQYYTDLINRPGEVLLLPTGVPGAAPLSVGEGRISLRVSRTGHMRTLAYTTTGSDPALPESWNTLYSQNLLEEGEWEYFNAVNRKIDRTRFEEFKSRFYELEGWDPATGWPTRSTLQDLGLYAVIAELAANGKLGYTLEDAILTLHNLTGMESPSIQQIPDINGDDKIGLQEAIHILQKLSGVRD